MKVYLYLAQRNKKGIQLLSVFKGDQYPAARLQNVKDLNLDPKLETKLQNKIHEDRMHWEPWLESAASFSELKEQLKKRGYFDLPMTAFPLFDIQREKLLSFSEMKKKPLIYVKNPSQKPVSKINSMLRRKDA